MNEIDIELKDPKVKVDQTELKAMFFYQSTIVTHFKTSVQLWDLRTKQNKG
jgi:hypothetical protein